ncbi:MAG: hypothetical protein J0H01_18770 [Rhizobiales bacterium]|nr:hypothetical protein [Hyphomicrobiales bacterium]
MASIVHAPQRLRPHISARTGFPGRPLPSAARRVLGFALLAGCLALPLIAALALRAYVFVLR